MVHEQVLGVELSNEYKLLLLCARTRLTEEIEEEIKSLIQQEIDWECLLHISFKHRLTPLLYWQLNSVCSDSVPYEVMERLKTYFNDNARKNLLFMGELQRILDLFESSGVKAIPYKGPVLANQAYGNLAFRDFSDLDIFINQKDVLKVKKILLSLGYEPKLKLSKKRELQYLKLQREYQFINKKNNISLEIQWNLADISFSFPNEPVFPLDQIKTELVEINHKKLSVFPDEDLLIILSLHTIAHLWGKLSWICDIAELVKNSEELNWDKIIKKSQHLAVERIIYLNLTLAQELSDVKIPQKVSDKINSDSKIKCLKHDVLQIILDDSDRGFIQNTLLRFNIREKRKDSLKDFIKIIVIPTSTEWQTLQKDFSLKILYIITRPVHFVNKIFK